MKITQKQRSRIVTTAVLLSLPMGFALSATAAPKQAKANNVASVTKVNGSFLHAFTLLEQNYQPLRVDDVKPLGTWPKSSVWMELEKSIRAGATNLSAQRNNDNVASLAASAGRLDIINALIARKFNSSPEFVRFDPLEKAAQRGQADMVRLLIEKGKVKVEGEKGRVLHHAARNGHLSVVKYLISVDHRMPRALDPAGWSPLHWIAAVGPTATKASLRRKDTSNAAVARFLLSRNMPVDEKLSTGQSPLFIAAVSGRADLVKLFLDYDATRNPVDNKGKTAIDNATDKKIKAMLQPVDTDDFFARYFTLKVKVDGTFEETESDQVTYSENTETFAISTHLHKGKLILSGIPMRAGTFKLGSYSRGGKKPIVQAFFIDKSKGTYDAWCSENSMHDGDGTGYVTIKIDALQRYYGDFSFHGVFGDKESSCEISGELGEL